MRGRRPAAAQAPAEFCGWARARPGMRINYHACKSHGRGAARSLTGTDSDATLEQSMSN